MCNKYGRVTWKANALMPQAGLGVGEALGADRRAIGALLLLPASVRPAAT